MALIQGNNNANYLRGTNNADDIYGYGGNDTLEGRNGNDFLSGGSGNDQLIGGQGTNNLRGGGGRDIFIMTDRTKITYNDDLILDFQFDIDRMDVSEWGVSSFDQIEALFVNQQGAAVVNAYYNGYNHFLAIDLVRWQDLLPKDFIFSNAGKKNEQGTNRDDVLFGSTGNDTLNGRDGDDDLMGGDGNDLLIGGKGIDYYNGGNGIDMASFANDNGPVTVNLNQGKAIFKNHIEFLDSIEQVTGTGKSDQISGNNVDNLLIGGAGNDTLDGRQGKDTLTGDSGADTFYFSTKLAKSNVDTVTDFETGVDTIQLSRGIFTELAAGNVPASAFAVGNPNKINDPNVKLIYNNNTGALLYDADGSGSGAAAVKFAVLDSGLGGSISHSDFFVV